MAKRRRKTHDEARIERITWFLMVLVFAVIYVLPDNSVEFWTVPAAGAAILLGSAVLQTLRRWHVSPITWIGGTVMLVLALINVYVEPDQNFFGIALLTFAAVIGFGVLTGET